MWSIFNLTLDGDDWNNYIIGGIGSDLIDGQGGNDTLSGSFGDDTLRGNSGDDVLYGSYGNDALGGLDGNDTLNGGDNDDIIYGDSGNDVIYGEIGNDQLLGGSGDDVIYGGDGNDVVYLSGEWEYYQIYSLGSDFYAVVGDDGYDIISEVEGLQFSDTGVVALDTLLSFRMPVGEGLVSLQQTEIDPTLIDGNDLTDQIHDNKWLAKNGPRISDDSGKDWVLTQEIGAYYDKFGGAHGAEDWNLPGSADIGEPVFSIYDGVVVDFVKTGGSEEGVVIGHDIDDDGDYDIYSFYNHLDLSSYLSVGSEVSTGEEIGQINSKAHLHFALGDDVLTYANDLSSGYYSIANGYDSAFDNMAEDHVLIAPDGLPLNSFEFIAGHGGVTGEIPSWALSG